MLETVKTLRAALDGGKSGPRVTAQLPIYLAGVSRPMVALGGVIGGGVILNFLPPTWIKEALGELAEGARVGSRDQKEIEATLFATAFISDDLEAARRPARKLLSRYGALKFYGNMMAHSGFKREIAAIRAAGRDAAAAVKAVSNELIDATLLGGSGARGRGGVHVLCAAGVRTTVLFTDPVDEDHQAAAAATIVALKQKQTA